MPEDHDLTEVLTAIERTQKLYRKPLPGAGAEQAEQKQSASTSRETEGPHAES
jgi:hypothetical protein